MATVQFQYMQVTSTARPAPQAPLQQEKGVTYVQESRPHSSLKAALRVSCTLMLMNPT